MVSIIIPTVDRQQSLVKLVESIDRQIFDASRVETLIVYNFSTKKRRPRFFIPSRFGIKVLQAPSPGVNHARNTGILAARGEILIFIDDDCVMDDPFYLQKVVDRHAQEPERLSLGGPYRLPPKASFWDRVYYANMTLWLQQQKVSDRASRALLGGNASYKSQVFADGPHGARRFTPGIKYGGSETMFNQKLFEDAGPHGFYEDLALTHQSRISLNNFIYKAYMQGRGYAEQTKYTPPELQEPLDLATIASRSLRLALHFYSFVFMIGYRSSIYERRFWWRSFLEESWMYLRKPFLPILQALRAARRLPQGEIRAGQ